MKSTYLQNTPFYLIIVLISICFIFSQNSDLPPFYKYESKKDIDFIIKKAPSKLALNRTKKLMKRWIENKKWSRANEILQWSK